MVIKKGDIFYADLTPTIGSEQGGIRPVLVISNNKGNKHSPTVIITTITSKIKHKEMPTHIPIFLETSKRSCNSLITVEHIKTISKSRLKEKVGRLSDDDFEKVKVALRISLDMD